MNKKLILNNEIYFLIEESDELELSDDDVDLSIVINGEKYFIEKDSYIYEIRHMLYHFCDSSNFVSTDIEDIGEEYFKYMSALFNDEDLPLHKYDCFDAFSNDITVLFYQRNKELFCQVTQNNWGKDFKTLCLVKLEPELLENWKKILSQYMIAFIKNYLSDIDNKLSEMKINKSIIVDANEYFTVDLQAKNYVVRIAVHENDYINYEKIDIATGETLTYSSIELDFDKQNILKEIDKMIFDS